MKSESTVFRLPEAHADHLQWLKDLDFYREEIAGFRKRLDEVANNFTDRDFLKLVGHFENQFIIQRDALDELNHQIKLAEHKLAEEVKSNAVAIEHRHVADHAELLGQYKMFEKLNGNLKHSFQEFLAKYL